MAKRLVNIAFAILGKRWKKGGELRDERERERFTRSGIEKFRR